MTRDAELKARDFVALVSAGVHAESDVGVAQRLILQAQAALNSYAEPGWACAEGWPAFADRLLELARAAEPGSDHQLTYVNALCTSVLSLHTAVLAALLDTDPAELGLQGLSVDTDLRWRIVIALATGGDLDGDGLETPFIDAEAQRTRPLQVGGTRPRRRPRPHPDVKAHTWEQVIENDTLANITTRAMIGGFVRPSQGRCFSPHAALLRRDRGRVGAPIERGGSDRGRRPVSVMGRQRRRAGSRRPVPRRRAAVSPATTRRRRSRGVERALRARAADAG